MSITFLESVKALSTPYDAFLIDLWGVIHDGIETYEGAADCLQQLKAAGKTIIFVSNAPRVIGKAVEKLDQLGISSSHYDGVITSGEVTRSYIQAGEHGYGKRYMMIGPERDNGLLEGTGYEHVSAASDADFLVVTGFDHDASVIEDVMPALEDALAHKLPLICANPDMLVVRISGVKALCAGVIAEKYQAMGGEVTLFGKPYPDIYGIAIKHTKCTDITRIAAIGDNLDTDILGANGQNIDSYLIPGGVLAQPLGITHGQLPAEQALELLLANSKARPTGVLPAFIW